MRECWSLWDSFSSNNSDIRSAVFFPQQDLHKLCQLAVWETLWEVRPAHRESLGQLADCLMQLFLLVPANFRARATSQSIVILCNLYFVFKHCLHVSLNLQIIFTLFLPSGWEFYRGLALWQGEGNNVVVSYPEPQGAEKWTFISLVKFSVCVSCTSTRAWNVYYSYMNTDIQKCLQGT